MAGFFQAGEYTGMTDDFKREPNGGLEPEEMPGEQEEYSFLTEKIKRKPVDKKKITGKVLAALGLGLVAGAGLCLAFYACRPLVSSWFPESGSTKVTIPKDDETEKKQEKEQSDKKKEQPVQKELTTSDYTKLYDKLYGVYQIADRAVVQVTGLKKDVDWFNMTYEDQGQASGVIIANSGQELLILTEKRAVAGAKKITVTFCNDEKAQATLKKYDGNTGFAVVGIPVGNVGKNTMDFVRTITLGNSNITRQGDPVIALGSPTGYQNSLDYGVISTTGNMVSTEDANYELLTTDIPWNENSSGVLINMDGELIGIISQKYCSEVSTSVTNYFGISDLKSLIEMLSNSEDISYVGIKAENVTNEISEDQKLPRGIYVTEVSLDSPAMKAGIQNNDVITEVDGSRIYSVDEFYSRLMNHKPKDIMRIVGKRKGPDGYTDIDYKVAVGVLK